MVNSQLRTNKVTDERILVAMGKIPRESFAPARLAELAYIDEDIPIGSGRSMLEPMILARMIQAANIGEHDVVLDVASGAGYSASILGCIARAVVALESDAELVKKALSKMSDLGVDNVVVEEGPIECGWVDQAPYDAIIVNGACAEIPETLFQQLSEGGRLCAVTTGESGVDTAFLWLKSNASISKRPLFDANIPSLPEFEKRVGFNF